MAKTQTVGHSKTHSHLHGRGEYQHGHWHLHAANDEEAHQHAHGLPDLWPHRAADVVEVVPGEEREHRR